MFKGLQKKLDNVNKQMRRLSREMEIINEGHIKILGNNHYQR